MKFRYNKIILSFVCLSFLLTSVNVPISHAQVTLPKPGAMVSLSHASNPAILRGIKVDTKNPFKFEFVLDQGSVIANPEGVKQSLKITSSPTDPRNDTALKSEANKLIKYFLAAITTPEKDLWVNLSPYEKDRIVPDSFGQTQMGRDLLAQDYLLKQLTASLIYPEDETGKKFWKKVYEQTANRNIPINTFNKVWIVPDKAVVYENTKNGTAYVVESSLKVLTEQDYLAKKVADTFLSKSNADKMVSVTFLKDIVIPELEKDVNQGANFAQLRQVYNSLILATWYKKKLKDSILSQAYADKNKVKGLEHQTQDVNAIYSRYLESFKKGTYNFIKEERDPITQRITPRKYFSGGLKMGDMAMQTTTQAPHFQPANFSIVQADVKVMEAEIARRAETSMEITKSGRHRLVDQYLADHIINNAQYRKFVEFGLGKKIILQEKVAPTLIEWFRRLLPWQELVGVDSKEEVIEQVRNERKHEIGESQGRLSIKQGLLGGADKLFPDNSVDVVRVFNVMQYYRLPMQDKMRAQIMRMLRPNGIYVEGDMSTYFVMKKIGEQLVAQKVLIDMRQMVLKQMNGYPYDAIFERSTLLGKEIVESMREAFVSADRYIKESGVNEIQRKRLMKERFLLSLLSQLRTRYSARMLNGLLVVDVTKPIVRPVVNSNLPQGEQSDAAMIRRGMLGAMMLGAAWPLTLQANIPRNLYLMGRNHPLLGEIFDLAPYLSRLGEKPEALKKIHEEIIQFANRINSQEGIKAVGSQEEALDYLRSLVKKGNIAVALEYSPSTLLRQIDAFKRQQKYRQSLEKLGLKITDGDWRKIMVYFYGKALYLKFEEGLLFDVQGVDVSSDIKLNIMAEFHRLENQIQELSEEMVEDRQQHFLGELKSVLRGMRKPLTLEEVQVWINKFKMMMGVTGVDKEGRDSSLKRFSSFLDDHRKIMRQAIDDRDQFMAGKLKEIVLNQDVVMVVGPYHVEGIKAIMPKDVQVIDKTFKDTAMLTMVRGAHSQKVIRGRKGASDAAMTTAAAQVALQSLAAKLTVRSTKPYTTFFVSNESKQEEALKILRETATRDNSVHIGVSGLQNLDFMASRRTQWGILIDINYKIGKIFKALEQVMKNNPQGPMRDIQHEFLQQLDGFLRVAPWDIDNNNEKIKAKVQSLSFWSNPEEFEHMRKMFLQGRIVFIQGNIENKSLIETIKRWMIRHKAVLDTFYISNVENYGRVKSTYDLWRNVLIISDEKTLILDSADGLLKLQVMSKKRYQKVIEQRVQEEKENPISNPSSWFQAKPVLGWLMDAVRSAISEKKGASDAAMTTVLSHGELKHRLLTKLYNQRFFVRLNDGRQLPVAFVLPTSRYASVDLDLIVIPKLTLEQQRGEFADLNFIYDDFEPFDQYVPQPGTIGKIGATLLMPEEKKDSGEKPKLLITFNQASQQIREAKSGRGRIFTNWISSAHEALIQTALSQGIDEVYAISEDQVKSLFTQGIRNDYARYSMYVRPYQYSQWQLEVVDGKKFTNTFIGWTVHGPMNVWKYVGHPTQIKKINGIQVKEYVTAQMVAKVTARRMANVLKSNNERDKDTRMITPTGGTFEIVYAEFLKILNEERIDCSRLHTFNMDEYYVGPQGTPWRRDKNSYYQYMRHHFFVKLAQLKLGWKYENAHFLNGNAVDIEKEVTRYEALIRQHPIDIALGGIGSDGHVAFNEPIIDIKASTKLSRKRLRDFNEFNIDVPQDQALEAVKNVIIRHWAERRGQAFKEYLALRFSLYHAEISSSDLDAFALKIFNQPIVIYVDQPERMAQEVSLSSASVIFKDRKELGNMSTRKVHLALPTLFDNSRYFKNINDIPLEALTIGTGTIKYANEVIIAATADKKASAVKASVMDKPTYEVSASQLQGHGNVSFIVDEKASKLIADQAMIKEQGINFAQTLRGRLILDHGKKIKIGFLHEFSRVDVSTIGNWPARLKLFIQGFNEEWARLFPSNAPLTLKQIYEMVMMEEVVQSFGGVLLLRNHFDALNVIVSTRPVEEQALLWWFSILENIYHIRFNKLHPDIDVFNQSGFFFDSQTIFGQGEGKPKGVLRRYLDALKQLKAQKNPINPLYEDKDQWNMLLAGLALALDTVQFNPKYISIWKRSRILTFMQGGLSNEGFMVKETQRALKALGPVDAEDVALFEEVFQMKSGALADELKFLLDFTPPNESLARDILSKYSLEKGLGEAVMLADHKSVIEEWGLDYWGKKGENIRKIFKDAGIWQGADAAMAKGGIDLKAPALDVKTQADGQGIKFDINPAMLEQLKNAPGFTPIITSIEPLPTGQAGITALKAFLGVL